MDLREPLFGHHLELAREGYKEDAVEALKIFISYVEEASSIPDFAKEYFLEEIGKLIEEKQKENTPHAFYLKRKGSKPPKQRKLINRNIAWAKQVHQLRYFFRKGGKWNMRKKPLAKDVAAREVAFTIDADGTKFQTILNAYNEYAEALYEELLNRMN